MQTASSPALTLSIVFALALVASMSIKFWLATRQMRHVAAHREQVPAPFAQRISLQAHQRAADYTLAKGRFGLLSMAFGAAVLLGWTLLGGLDPKLSWAGLRLFEREVWPHVRDLQG